MKKQQPIQKRRLELDTTVVRRLDDAALRAVDGAVPPMRSAQEGESCTCFCNWTK